MTSGVPITVHDLGNVLSKATVVVTLRGRAANVRLMDRSNVRAFKQGKKHKAYGAGLVKKSPHRIKVPRTGHWYVTVDMMGLSGTVKSSIHVEPPPLPVARSASLSSSPLLQIEHERPPAILQDTSETWDVFICHASEDKAAVAWPLEVALRERGLTVWLDTTELRIGDDRRQRISHGLRHSTFGIVILSQSFFSKGWAQYELGGIVGQSISGKQNMLPIWHEITEVEVEAHDPSLANKIALATSEYSIEEIADKIAEVVDDTDDKPED